MDTKYRWFMVVGALILALLAFNFLNFHVSSSRNHSHFSVGTARSGEALPADMTVPFRLAYQVRGADRLVEPLADALQTELSGLPTVLEAAPVAERAAAEAGAPLLVVEVNADAYFWTPFYARGTATAVFYFDSEGDVAWQSGDPLVLETSPAIKSEGEFTLEDSSWGLISKPAYAQHLSAALAQSIADGLHKEVFTLPSGG